MGARLDPSAALYGTERRFPALPPCVHYAGSERHIAKALQLQKQMGPVFDVACDCEDGAPVGQERAHAETMAALIAGPDNAFDRVGARIHDLSHAAWRVELDIEGKPLDSHGFQNWPANIETKSFEAALCVPKRKSGCDAREQIENPTGGFSTPWLMVANQAAIQRARSKGKIDMVICDRPDHF